MTGESIPVKHYSDMGNARRFAEMYAGQLKYVHGRDQWLIWDKTRWKVDNKSSIMRAAKKCVRRMYEIADKPFAENHDPKLAEWALKSESKTRLDAMVALARSEPEIAVEPEELDSDPWLLNCSNGTLDLRTLQLRKHTPDDLITKLVNVDYDFMAECPTWDTFLTTVFGNDTDLIQFVQRAVGYSITGVIREHLLFFAFGGGANGKSTFIETIAELFGEFTARLRTEALMTRSQSAIPADIATLAGARLCISDENDAGQRWAENTVKQLTGGDRITARFMRQNFFSFDPTHHVWTVGNHKPDVGGVDEGIWRRMRLIPFDVTIPESERDTGLRDKLRAELPGILTWAVAGCANWQREGVGWCAKVLDATMQYRSQMDIIADFSASALDMDANARISCDDLYGLYTDYMERHGERAIKTQRQLGSILRDRGFQIQRSNSKDYWKGFKQKSLVNSLN